MRWIPDSWGLGTKSEHANLLPRYKHLRQVGLPLNNQLVKSLSREDLHEGARKLGIFRKNTIVLDNEDQSSVLMDFCIHDVRRGGMNAIERYLAESPPPDDSDEMLLLKAKQQSWYSLFEVLSVEGGVGIEAQDLLRRKTIFIVDVGFSQTGHRGAILASRMMVPDDIPMTGGAALPVTGFSHTDCDRFLQTIATMLKDADLSQLPPKAASDLTAKIVSTCIKHGASQHVYYQEPGEVARTPPAVAQPIRIGRNDPCRCGSGRKFKHCCGSAAGKRK